MAEDDTYVDFSLRQPTPARQSFWYDNEGYPSSAGYQEKLYVTKCNVRKAHFYKCILDDCILNNCTMTNCIVTSGPWGYTDNCTFKNCIMRGANEHILPVNRGTFVNCKIEYATEARRSMTRRFPKDPEATKLDTYECFSNVVLKEHVVDYLRRWAWRVKRDMRAKKICELRKKAKLFGPVPPPEMLEDRDSEMDFAMGNNHKAAGRVDSAGHDRSEPFKKPDFTDASIPIPCEPIDHTNDDILDVWSVKKAGKRPLHVNDSYFAEQQLGGPVLRMHGWGPQNPLQLAQVYGEQISNEVYR